MKKFIFQFEALRKYRQNRRDLCRQLLGQILADDSQLQAERNQIEQTRAEQLAELRQINASGTVNIDQSASRRYYAAQLSGEMRLVERKQQVVAEQLSMCRQALLQADRDVKVLDRLEEKQRAMFEHEQQLRANRELEEVWLAGRYSEFQS